MGVIRQVLADLIYSDEEERRTEPEQRFVALVRAIAREEADKPIEIVAALPAEAPRARLLRLANSPDLYMGNGAGQPLSKFIPAP